ncbi:hypothetical protein [Acidihalobacter ferrooxydans]|uniref:hypothetical protein n=1 Tax=Acidihalobacter ferrooxydans TaxID=1765967 RepID=UPI0012EB0C53|nr:hypothetical protein [Acidihalobacter ferrooxydans]
MNAETAQVIAAYVAVAVPATVAIANIAKVLLEWMQQGHKVREAQIQQSHQITTHYLDKALDPTVPLAIRHQFEPPRVFRRLFCLSQAALADSFCWL